MDDYIITVDGNSQDHEGNVSRGEAGTTPARQVLARPQVVDWTHLQHVPTHLKVNVWQHIRSCVALECVDSSIGLGDKLTSTCFIESFDKIIKVEGGENYIRASRIKHRVDT